MARGRLLKIHSVGASRGLTVPRDIDEQVPDDVRFVPEIVEEGILYRAYRNGRASVEPKRPDWTRRSGYEMPGPSDG